MFLGIARGEFNISGLQNKSLRRFLRGKNSSQVSRLLTRLRLHGLIKKVGRTYKYYLTQFGKAVIATGLKLRELSSSRSSPSAALRNSNFLTASRRIQMYRH